MIEWIVDNMEFATLSKEECLQEYFETKSSEEQERIKHDQAYYDGVIDTCRAMLNHIAFLKNMGRM